MSSPAFLVDGVMEQRIIQHLCPHSAVRLIGCNGDDVSMEAIARAIDAQMRLLKKWHPIVILIDRERRTEAFAAIKAELQRLLDARGYKDQYVLGVADRTIENWILADWQHVRAADTTYKELPVGPIEHGKSILRRLLPDNIFYTETTLGVELFLKCRPEKLHTNSPSFRDFVDDLNIHCRWLSKLDGRFSPPPFSQASEL